MDVEQEVQGKGEHLRQAVDVLASEGFLDADSGGYRHARKYREADDPEASDAYGNTGDDLRGRPTSRPTGRGTRKGRKPAPSRPVVPSVTMRDLGTRTTKKDDLVPGQPRVCRPTRPLLRKGRGTTTSGTHPTRDPMGAPGALFVSATSVRPTTPTTPARLALHKNRRRDPRARDYGLYWLLWMDIETPDHQSHDAWIGYPDGFTLDEVEAYLTGDTADRGTP